MGLLKNLLLLHYVAILISTLFHSLKERFIMVKEQLPRVCIGSCVPCQVGNSIIDGQNLGVGIFTNNSIDAGTLVWKYNCNEYNDAEAREILGKMSSQEEKRLWVEHIFAWKDKITEIRDDFELINHSIDPNCYFSQEDGSIRALKNIKAGDELFVDYGKLGSYPDFYLKLMKEYGSWFSFQVQKLPRVCIGSCVPCKVGNSIINGQNLGVGIFTNNSIDAETLIWKYNCNEYSDAEAREILGKMSSQEEKRLWVEHIFAWKDKITEIKDDFELINHSTDPNCYFSQKDGSIRALKNIKAGDELFVDYRKLGSYPDFYLTLMEEYGSWFSSQV